MRREDVRGALESLLIIGVLYFGVSAVMMLALRTDSPTMAVLSDSMKPAFERGDMLVLQGIISPGDVEVGDVIVYQIGEATPISHRVVYRRIEGGGVWYVTKGDANVKLDNDIGFSPALGVEPDQVIGKVVLVIPKIGYVTLYPWISGSLIILLFFAMWVVRRD